MTRRCGYRPGRWRATGTPRGGKGTKVTVGDLAKLRAAWESYDEWSEDYAWQAGLSGVIVDIDAEDGTLQVYYGEEELEVEPDKKVVTFETAPIKHIKDKTLKPFKKKFKKVVIFFYRPAELCGHCPAIKSPFARVADYVMERNTDPTLAFAAIDCGHVKGAALELCQSTAGRFQGVPMDGFGMSVPRIVYWDNEEDWETSGAAYTDPGQLGAEPGPLLKFMAGHGTVDLAELHKPSYRDDL
eukprot:SAG22_NODE_1553_length_4141_cov_2.014349_1_plen_242_part_00